MSRFGRLGLQLHSSRRITAARKVKRFASLILEELEDRTLLAAGTAEPFVQGLYQVLLQRTPAAEEVSGWASAMNQSLTPAQVVDSFLTSAEFSDRIGPSRLSQPTWTRAGTGHCQLLEQERGNHEEANTFRAAPRAS